ncbi:hypothetical protein PF007_g19699 [Phytophthora fragariae]|uniref:Uncharacterized protein n=1 Tax=Phytophthora fragariae TaxID=53985 RepID=A0A6A3R3H5_9STRA|nr:hypothetical protein PF011_g11656 [Phytophthora fragariae]KAE9089146.1 hypothetical protein PF007_g19699 [Phytophthora fragariae]
MVTEERARAPGDQCNNHGKENKMEGVTEMVQRMREDASE